MLNRRRRSARRDLRSEQRVKKLIGGKERYVYLPRPLPVHLEYFTAFVDDSGELQVRDDVYGYSRRVKAALGLEGIAETAGEPVGPFGFGNI